MYGVFKMIINYILSVKANQMQSEFCYLNMNDFHLVELRLEWYYCENTIWYFHWNRYEKSKTHTALNGLQVLLIGRNLCWFLSSVNFNTGPQSNLPWNIINKSLEQWNTFLKNPGKWGWYIIHAPSHLFITTEWEFPHFWLNCNLLSGSM